MTTIAFAGCWHANSTVGISAVRFLAERGVTTLVHTGDFLYSYPVARKFLNELEEECKKLGMTIIVVRGNHDNPDIYRNFTLETNLCRANGEVFTTHGQVDEFARIRPHILHAHDGLTWTWDGVKFGALGGARSIDWKMRTLGESWWMDEVTSPAAIDRIAKEPTDVLIMHDVPFAVPLHFADRMNIPFEWDLAAAEEHRRPLQKAVDGSKPSFVISGHMHARQHEEVTSSGHTFTSVILDRGDYNSIGTPSRAILKDNLLLMEIENGKIKLKEF